MSDFDLRKLQRLASTGDERALAKLQWYAEKHNIGVDWTDQKVFPLCTGLDVAKYFQGGWNGKFTLVNTETQVRHSFKLKRARKKKTRASQSLRPSWVSLWNGSSWVYVGMIRPNLRGGAATFQAQRQMPETAVKAINYVLRRVNTMTWPHAQMEFWHHGVCGRCGAPLFVESYKKKGKLVAGVAMGLGPHCARKAAQATLKRAT